MKIQTNTVLKYSNKLHVFIARLSVQSTVVPTELSCKQFKPPSIESNTFSGSFTKLQKTTISFIMSVRWSVWNKFGSHWTDVQEI
jgi:hypothetical protein